MTKLAEKRVIRDPIHGYIHIDEQVIWDCINTREFQRLRRVRQLGATLMVFPSGEHSRATHSLGVYEVAHRMITEVDEIKDRLTEHEKIVVLVAALLHDIGHAPFSHSFESIMTRKHEYYTTQIIRGPSEIADVLRKEDPGLPEEVASVIEHTHPNPILHQLITSQLDADRLDYLLRDSYFTGTSYGQVDLDRLLRTMRIAGNKVCMKASSMYTVENYIMARYHMYWQVYYHANSRSFDSILKSLFTRLKDLNDAGDPIMEKFPMYRKLFESEVLTNDEFFKLDDSTCMYSFSLMRDCEDEVLRDLARRIMDRDLFEVASADSEEKIVKKCREKGLDPRYYVVKDHMQQVPYQPYKGDSGENIWVLEADGRVEELSKVSKVVEALSRIDERVERLFCPKELLDD